MSLAYFEVGSTLSVGAPARWLAGSQSIVAKLMSSRSPRGRALWNPIGPRQTRWFLKSRRLEGQHWFHFAPSKPRPELCVSVEIFARQLHPPLDSIRLSEYRPYFLKRAQWARENNLLDLHECDSNIMTRGPAGCLRGYKSEETRLWNISMSSNFVVTKSFIFWTVKPGIDVAA